MVCGKGRATCRLAKVMREGRHSSESINDEKVLYIEDLVSDDTLVLSRSCYGIYIPGDEFLKRTKYQWFPVLSHEEIVNSNMAIANYFNISMIDASIQQQYNMSTLL